MTSRRQRKGCGIALTCAGALFVVCALALLIPAWRLPQDAPLARMYRTEADLAVLVKAVNEYRNAHNAYPPPGSEGLRMATDYLARTVRYFPSGPPLDGWGRPFIYAPSAAYADPASLALQRDGAYCAPDTYQIYSLGADGATGIENVDQQADNIVSWDKEKRWRKEYFRLNSEYMLQRRAQP